MSAEIPKGLSDFISQAKETSQYKRKVLERQVINLSEIMLKSNTSRERILPPVTRKVGKDTVVLRLERSTDPNNGDSMEVVELKLAVNPDNEFSREDFGTVFTSAAFGVKNAKFEPATVQDLENYLETLKYFKNESNKDKRKKIIKRFTENK